MARHPKKAKRLPGKKLRPLAGDNPMPLAGNNVQDLSSSIDASKIERAKRLVKDADYPNEAILETIATRLANELMKAKPPQS